MVLVAVARVTGMQRIATFTRKYVCYPLYLTAFTNLFVFCTAFLVRISTHWLLLAYSYLLFSFIGMALQVFHLGVASRALDALLLRSSWVILVLVYLGIERRGVN